jgi:hypothetical protein
MLCSKPIEALEPLEATPFVHQVGEESASCFGIGAIAIQCEMKRALDEVFEHDESPLAEKIQNRLAEQGRE